MNTKNKIIGKNGLLAAGAAVLMIASASAAFTTSRTIVNHNRYDTVYVMKAEQQLEDMEFVLTFVKRMANATIIPIPRTIPYNLKEKLEKFSGRKR